MLIDATHAEETRVVVVDGNKVEEFDFESENKRQLAGNIYLAKVTRVEPSLQAAFVDYGGNRHGFLAFSEIHPDYYQIPVADREALMEEERAYAEAMKARDEEDEKEKKPSKSRSRSRSRSKPKADTAGTAEEAAVVESAEIQGMETIDLGVEEDSELFAVPEEGSSPVDRVAETPVEEPADEPEAEAPSEETAAEEVPAAEADAPEAGTATAEEPAGAAEEAVAEEPAAEEAAAEEAEASEAEAEAKPQAPMAAAAADKDAVISAEPAGEENAAEASGDAPEAEEPAAEAPAEEAKAEEAAAEEAAADETALAEAPAADVAEAAPAEEIAAEESAAEEPAAEAPAKPKSRSRSRKKAKEPEADDASDESESSDDDEDDAGSRADATSKDSSIESVADEDDSEDIRPRRKPRPRRYKIQEVIKVRQVLLVQVVKEERGNKGAALTTYLSLAGRYCVLMPNTARGGGISRKITNAVDRKKLKEIANEIDVPTGAGLIVRTAGAKRTKAEIKRDYEYLQRMWEQIRELTLKSIAPAKIYEEGDLIKRSIRDLYSREIDEVLVEGERGYRIAKDFMKMIMPSHAKNVQRYEDQLPLLARYQVESYLGGMFNPTVQLKSGGYIVIGVTEALVAIDVNSGRATKQGSIEETALNTNLEAAEEVARQLRLRDLAGLIVIDFIDMDERKNNAAVEKRMKDKLKTDRARIQVGRISGFGLMEMSRQRLRPGMIEATTQPCPACHGTGLIRSDDNMALSILRQIEEEGTRRKSREVLVRCPVSIANYLMNQKREHIAQIEARYGLSVRIEGDAHLVSPDFTIEKFKTATRVIKAPSAPVVSVDSSIMDEVDAEEVIEAEAVEVTEAEPVAEGDDDKPKRKRRRRRRRSKSGTGEGGEARDDNAEGEAEGEAQDADSEGESDAQPAEAAEGDEEKKPKRRRSRSRSRSRKSADAEAEVKPEEAEAQAEEPAEAAAAETAAEEAPAEAVAEAETAVEPAAEPAQEAADTAEAEAPAEAAAEEAPAEEAAAPEGEAEEAPEAEAADEEAPAEEPAEAEAAEEAPAEETAAETPAEEAPAEEPAAEPEPESPSKPKRRGWWSMAN